jgi:hypothetical protein
VFRSERDDQDYEPVPAIGHAPEGVRLNESDRVSVDGVRSSIRTGFGMSTKDSTAVLRRWLWLAAILLGALQVWTHRYTLSTHDSVSYLDIADAYLRNDWQAALNPHWSPLYSWLLALALSILEPTPYWELFVVKLVNFLVYLSALVAFNFFLGALIAHNHRQSERDDQGGFLRVPEWVWLLSGYSLFLWSALKWTTLYSDTPDLTTCVFVYLAAGILLRARCGADGWRSFLLLGVVLGLAYLSKTALLPISLAFLAVGLLSTGNFRRDLPRVVVAGLALAVVSAPFVAAISAQENRLTFGEAGKYMYVLFVNPGFPGKALRHWQGDKRPEFGVPEHPTREIHGSPSAFEFKTPIAGSYPPWFNPSYWHAGLEMRLDLKRQTNVLAKNLVFAWSTFLGALAFGYLALISGRDRFLSSLAALKSNVTLLVPAAAGLAAYFLAADLPQNDLETQPAMRYIAPFAVLLFAGVFSSVRMPDSKESRQWLKGITFAAVAVVFASLIADPVRERLDRRLNNKEHVEWDTAAGLAGRGILPGDEIAHLGYGLSLYWARLAKVRIIAEIDDEVDFWSAAPPVRAEALRAVEQTGAKAVVAASTREKPASAAQEGWQRIGDSSIYVYLFE